MNVNVIGLGRLGAPLAILAASKGHAVLAIDVDQRPVDAILHGQSPVEETGLPELMKDVMYRSAILRAATTMEHAGEAEVSLIVVPTPSNQDGQFSTVHVVHAVQALGVALARHAPWKRHTVVVVSTLMPGSMDGPVRQALEQASGRSVGPELGLVYAPQLVALGSVLHDLQHPDLWIIGASDARAASGVLRFFESIVEITPGYLPLMSLEEAEVAKLAINAYVTMKMSFANVLGEIAARRGLDAQKIAAAVGADSRIGTKYLKPATGYGGPCFPRDNRAFAAFARKIGMPAELAEATDLVNRRQCDRVADWIARQKVVGQSLGVGILGLAYKPGTNVTDESAGWQVAEELLRLNVPVLVHDPKALTGPPGAVRVELAQGLVHRSNIVVIMTPWPEYKDLKFGEKPVYDPWRIRS